VDFLFFCFLVILLQGQEDREFMSGASPFVGRPPSKRPIASASNKSAVERLTNYQLDEFREAFENIE
jgi:hypothetical protein